jgi:hypothetical protein
VVFIVVLGGRLNAKDRRSFRRRQPLLLISYLIQDYIFDQSSGGGVE